MNFDYNSKGCQQFSRAEEIEKLNKFSIFYVQPLRGWWFENNTMNHITHI